MPSQNEDIEYLYSLLGAGIKLGLERTVALLSILSTPEQAFPSIIVGGTNGKGSAAATIESVLTAGGYLTGLYTSPHLVKFNERIRVGKTDIPDKILSSLIKRVKTLLEEEAPLLGPSFFEFSTALAFEYFRDRRVQIAILEVGMGGRLDSTNVVTNPLVSVITSVSLDHESSLGETLPEIAREKAGIIKEGGVVVTGVNDPAALAVIEETTREREADLYILGRDFSVSQAPSGAFDYSGINIALKGLKTPLKGIHQLRNAACALAALELLSMKGFPVEEGAVREGLASVRWRARFEKVMEEPAVILDCAHNPAAADALLSNLRTLSYERLILVIGVMADKDIDGLIARLAPLASVVVATEPRAERAAGAGIICEKLACYGVEVREVTGVPLAICSAISEAGRGDLILVTGSLYTVGEALAFFDERNDPLR